MNPIDFRSQKENRIMKNNSTINNRHGSATVTLPSDTEILITRLFDASAAVVFEAWTTPDLVRQ